VGEIFRPFDGLSLWFEAEEVARACDLTLVLQQLARRLRIVQSSLKKHAHDLAERDRADGQGDALDASGATEAKGSHEEIQSAKLEWVQMGSHHGVKEMAGVDGTS
jgi:hypothetical protein